MLDQRLQTQGNRAATGGSVAGLLPDRRYPAGTSTTSSASAAGRRHYLRLWLPEDLRRTALQAVAAGWRDDPGTVTWLRDRAAADRHEDVRQAAVQALAAGWPGEMTRAARVDG